jgi:arylformamidase
MRVNITYNKQKYVANLTNPLDISIPIAQNGVNAWGVDNMRINPVNSGDWIGDVEMGSPVNFNNIFFNPHAHTTHTECLGHISPEKESLNQELLTFFFISDLISIAPKKVNNDFIITKNLIKKMISKEDNIEALIIRTIPNSKSKKHKNYSNTNPPYLSEEAARYLVSIGVRHLLVDLPSIDKEDDHGALIAHKTFWQFPENKRHGCTITEFIYVPNNIKDGKYLLNLQFIPFKNDASPSRPVLFKLEVK